LTSLIRFIGATSFNHLLMRKNFCTWRRGMQIQYNATYLEEWCTKHNVAEASLYLEPLMQAAKLLQLNKTSADDVEIMFDVCFLLSPMQIKKVRNFVY
jgi:myosin-5